MKSPVLAGQFTSDFNWTMDDFIVMGLLIIGIISIYLLASKKLADRSQKLWLALCLVLAFIYIWAELAVGIFTNLGS